MTMQRKKCLQLIQGHFHRCLKDAVSAIFRLKIPVYKSRNRNLFSITTIRINFEYNIGRGTHKNHLYRKVNC